MMDKEDHVELQKLCDQDYRLISGLNVATKSAQSILEGHEGLDVVPGVKMERIAELHVELEGVVRSFKVLDPCILNDNRLFRNCVIRVNNEFSLMRQVSKAICELGDIEVWLERRVSGSELRSTVQIQMDRYCTAPSILERTLLKLSDKLELSVDQLGANLSALSELKAIDAGWLLAQHLSGSQESSRVALPSFDETRNLYLLFKRQFLEAMSGRVFSDRHLEAPI